MKKVSFQKGIFILPSLFTTASLFCGFFSIVRSIGGDYHAAVMAIFLCGFFDLADGRIARMTSTQSEFGKEYDSLVDLVAFGLAPAILMYQWTLSKFNPFGWIVAFLYVACAAMRLARFNVYVGVVEKKKFQGLPTPPSAGTLISMVLFFGYWHGTYQVTTTLPLVVMPALSLLMVSNVSYRSFKEFDVKKTNSIFALIFLALVIGLIAMKPEVVIFVMALAYALSGPLAGLFNLRKRPTAAQKAQTTQRKLSVVDMKQIDNGG